MAAAAKLFSRRGDDTGIALHFAFKWASVQRGLVVGFVIAIVTVVVDEHLAEPFQHHPGDPRHHRTRPPHGRAGDRATSGIVARRRSGCC